MHQPDGPQGSPVGRLCSHVHRPLEVYFITSNSFIFNTNKGAKVPVVAPLSIIPLEKVLNDHTTSKTMHKDTNQYFLFFLLDSTFKMFKNVIKRMFDVLLGVRLSA